MSTGEVHEYTLGALSALPLGRDQTPAIFGDDGVELSGGRDDGPSLSVIRRTLEGPAVTVTAGGAVREAIAELEALQAGEEERRRRAVELQQQIEAEVSRQRQEKQAEASALWSRVSALAERGDEAGKRALEVFIDSYRDVTVMVGEQSHAVNIPEVAAAETWLARYEFDFQEAEFRTHRYRMYRKTMSWHEAEALCREHGGHLVAITTSSENTFVYDTFADENPIWIGLSDEASEGAFVWVTQEETTFFKWFNGEPNNGGGKEHYVSMGNWRSQTSGRYFVFKDSWNDMQASGHMGDELIMLPLCEFE